MIETATTTDTADIQRVHALSTDPVAVAVLLVQLQDTLDQLSTINPITLSDIVKTQNEIVNRLSELEKRYADSI